MLIPIHAGPETLDEACNDYCVRNLDLYDVEGTIKDVLKQMNTNPVISFPAECDFSLLRHYIREAATIGKLNYYKIKSNIFFYILISNIISSVRNASCRTKNRHCSCYRWRTFQ